MKKFNSLDYRLLGEFLKNSRRSDRELAKVLGSSQPTISRRRRKLEKELIEGYSAIPNWSKLGYEIMVFSFVKLKQALGPVEAHEHDHMKARGWMMNHPNVIFAANCRGLGFDGFMISVHRSYTDFDMFIEEHNREMGGLVDGLETVIVNLASPNTLKPLDFKYLAKTLSEMAKPPR